LKSTKIDSSIFSGSNDRNQSITDSTPMQAIINIRDASK
jgi:hypothetical protein